MEEPAKSIGGPEQAITIPLNDRTRGRGRAWVWVDTTPLEEDDDEAAREGVFVATTRCEEEEPEIERGVEEKGRPRTGFGGRPRRGS